MIVPNSVKWILILGIVPCWFVATRSDAPLRSCTCFSSCTRRGWFSGVLPSFLFFSAHLATAVPGGVPSFTESDAIGRPHYAAAESVFVFLCFCVFHFWVGRTHIFLGFFGLSFLRYIPKLATDFSFTSPCLPRQTGSCGC